MSAAHRRKIIANFHARYMAAPAESRDNQLVLNLRHMGGVIPQDTQVTKVSLDGTSIQLDFSDNTGMQIDAYGNIIRGAL